MRLTTLGLLAIALASLGANRKSYAVAEGELRPRVVGATCPPEMADVDGRFCVDRWEAMLVEVHPDGSVVRWSPYGSVDDATLCDGCFLRAVSVPDATPQAYISGARAELACTAAGKRLCAPVEWRKACRGPADKAFGYADAPVAGRCNDGGRSPMLAIFPQVATSWKSVGMAEMNDPRLNQLDGTVALTGAHRGCTNGYGVFDMIGNLHEWTSDPNGTFQGGYYLDTRKNGDGCMYRTSVHEFTYHDYSTGFRCCRDPEPGDGSRASVGW
jgi:hypothetical protein